MQTCQEVVLEARGVRRALSGGRRLEVDLRVARGEVLQLCGPSGSGKTTLLRILARLTAPASGELRLRGVPSSRVAPGVWRRQVLYLAQQPVMFPGSGRDNLLAGFDTARAPAPPADLEEQGARLLRELGLAPAVVLPQDARTLSGGEAARLALARALLVGPEVLLADEPAASLDLPAARRLAAVLRAFVAGGGAVVLVAHDEAPWEGVERRVQRLNHEERAS